jgi:hypothetical protein
MKIAVLIREDNKKGTQQTNDLVGIFETDHPFSQKELDLFSFIEVDDSVVEAFNTELSAKYQSDPGFTPIRKYYDNGELKFTY